MSLNLLNKRSVLLVILRTAMSGFLHLNFRATIE